MQALTNPLTNPQSVEAANGTDNLSLQVTEDQFDSSIQATEQQPSIHQTEIINRIIFSCVASM